MTALAGIIYAAGLALAVVAVLAAVEWHSRRAWKIARQVARLEGAARLGAAIGKLDLAEAELRELRQRAEIAALEARIVELRGEMRDAEADAREASESEAEVLAAAAVTRCGDCGRVEVSARPPVQIHPKHAALVCRHPTTFTGAGGLPSAYLCGSCDLCVGEGG